MDNRNDEEKNSPNELTVTWEDFKAEALEDTEVLKAYKELTPKYEIIDQILKARIEQNLSQSELADKVGTKQSNISRLEHGRSNPSLQFLKKVASSLGKELHIKFV
jgi:ribosome-binding protein aMBF1 (putative translation factor)